jgi:WD40 repeat protein
MVMSVAYLPNGQHIISGSFDRTIQIWDTRTGGTVGKPLKGHTGSVECVAYSPDGQYIFSGSVDNTIHKWNAFPQPCIPLHPTPNPIYPNLHASADPDGWV